jgi:hypothetical protein
MNNQMTLIEKSTMDAVSQAQALVVATPAAYVQAAETRKAIKALLNQIDLTFDPVIKAAHLAHKEAVAAKKKHQEPLEQADRIIGQKRMAYDAEQERIRREKEAALQALAQKQAEDEALAQAEMAEAAGATEEAEAILSEPVVAAPVFVPSSVPVVQGAVVRQNWKARVVNPALVPDEYWVIDEQKLGALARALKGAGKVPGVEFYSETSEHFRG